MKIRIVNDSKSYTRLYIDGVEMHRVVSYELKESVDERMSLVVEYQPEEIVVEGDAVVELKSLEDIKKEEGYKDFIRFIFRGVCGKKEEQQDDNAGN